MSERYVGIWNVEGTTEDGERRRREAERFRHQETTEVILGVCALVMAVCYILIHA